jgi:parvulin-like peptidyl-prolyl isomerase
MLSIPLSAEQEREAKVLEAKIQAAVQTELADLARLLVSKSDRDLFGSTEFQVRDIVLRVGAKAYAELLREKKTATKVPE